MTIDHLEIRKKIITYARKLQAERLVYSTAGNISVRIPEEPGLLACTPASPSTTCSSRKTSRSSRWTVSRSPAVSRRPRKFRCTP